MLYHHAEKSKYDNNAPHRSNSNNGGRCSMVPKCFVHKLETPKTSLR